MKKQKLKIGDNVCIEIGLPVEKVVCGKIVGKKDISKDKSHTPDYRRRFPIVYKVRFYGGDEGFYDSGELNKIPCKCSR